MLKEYHPKPYELQIPLKRGMGEKLIEEVLLTFKVTKNNKIIHYVFIETSVKMAG